MIEEWLLSVASSPIVLPVLLALVVLDAFLVVLPSETAVVALATVSATSGTPPLAALIAIAALGAMIGDSACFALGRLAGTSRWRWQRRTRIAAALERVAHTVRTRPAVLIFTARYIPFARIAVNLTAGAAGLPYARFLPLSALAGAAWALYNAGVGLAFGIVLRENPVLAVGVSVVVAIALGLVIDAIARRVASDRAARGGGVSE